MGFLIVSKAKRMAAALSTSRPHKNLPRTVSVRRCFSCRARRSCDLRSLRQRRRQAAGSRGAASGFRSYFESVLVETHLPERIRYRACSRFFFHRDVSESEEIESTDPIFPQSNRPVAAVYI